MFQTYSRERFLRTKTSPLPKAQAGFEPADTGVADHCLTSWLLRLIFVCLHPPGIHNVLYGNYCLFMFVFAVLST